MSYTGEVVELVYENGNGCLNFNVAMFYKRKKVDLRIVFENVIKCFNCNVFPRGDSGAGRCPEDSCPQPRASVRSVARGGRCVRQRGGASVRHQHAQGIHQSI